MPTTLPALTRALVIRAMRAEHDPLMVGAALATLRRDVAAGEHDDHPARRSAADVERAIRAVDQADCPPDTDLVATLLETLATRLGEHGGHAAAWRCIGVRPGRGRDLLARQAQSVDWPLWRTLRDAALDGIDVSIEAAGCGAA